MAQQTEAKVVKTPQEEEFAEWLLHPVTKRLRAQALREYEALKDDWAEGKFSSDNQFLMAQYSANAIGKCEVLYKIADLKFEDTENEDE